MNVIKVISELFCFKNTGYKSSTVCLQLKYTILYTAQIVSVTCKIKMQTEIDSAVKLLLKEHGSAEVSTVLIQFSSKTV